MNPMPKAIFFDVLHPDAGVVRYLVTKKRRVRIKSSFIAKSTSDTSRRP